MQKVSYMGDGSTTEFTFNFPYFENTDIIVTENGATATGYSIVGNSAGLDADIPYTGGTVVFETAPSSLDSITIARSLPMNRVADYQPTAKIEPTTLNQDLNYMMEVLKDLQDELDTLRTQYADIADQESTTTLLARISAIHDEIVAVSAQITALGDISTIRSDITTLDTRTTNLLDYVIESQNPTSTNNYTWYRKYKSGWVEQGGKVSGSANAILPKRMSDKNYYVLATCRNTGTAAAIGVNLVNETTLYINCGNYNVDWYVCGIAA